MGPPSGTSFGLDDCPPHGRIPEDPPNTLELLGDDSSHKRARRLFHADLVRFLADRKMTVEEMLCGRIEALELRFTKEELDDLLRSAAGVYSHVECVTESGEQKYRATPKGENLPPPRSVSLAERPNVFLLGRHAGKRWWAAVGFVSLLTGLSIASLRDAEAWQRELAIAVGALGLILLMLLYGFLGERDLKAAALAWPRFKDYRPHFYDWVTHSWRQAFFPIAGWVFGALLAATWLLWRWKPTAAPIAMALTVIVLLVIVVAYLFVRRTRNDFLHERKQVKECRESKEGKARG
jgi:hypothetical protein